MRFGCVKGLTLASMVVWCRNYYLGAAWLAWVRVLSSFPRVSCWQFVLRTSCVLDMSGVEQHVTNYYVILCNTSVVSCLGRVDLVRLSVCRQPDKNAYQHAVLRRMQSEYESMGCQLRPVLADTWPATSSGVSEIWTVPRVGFLLDDVTAQLLDDLFIDYMWYRRETVEPGDRLLRRVPHSIVWLVLIFSDWTM